MPVSGCYHGNLSVLSPGTGYRGGSPPPGPRGPAHRVPAITVSPYLHHALHRAQRPRTHPREYQLPGPDSILVSVHSLHRLPIRYSKVIEVAFDEREKTNKFPSDSGIYGQSLYLDY